MMRDMLRSASAGASAICTASASGAGAGGDTAPAPLTQESIVPFGMHKGINLHELLSQQASYCDWVLRQDPPENPDFIAVADFLRVERARQANAEGVRQRNYLFSMAAYDPICFGRYKGLPAYSVLASPGYIGWMDRTVHGEGTHNVHLMRLHNFAGPSRCSFDCCLLGRCVSADCDVAVPTATPQRKRSLRGGGSEEAGAAAAATPDAAPEGTPAVKRARI